MTAPITTTIITIHTTTITTSTTTPPLRLQLPSCVYQFRLLLCRVPKCRLRWLLLIKLCGHQVQRNGLIPECMARCCFKLFLRLHPKKFWPHNRQTVSL